MKRKFRVVIDLAIETEVDLDSKFVINLNDDTIDLEDEQVCNKYQQYDPEKKTGDHKIKHRTIVVDRIVELASKGYNKIRIAYIAAPDWSCAEWFRKEIRKRGIDTGILDINAINIMYGKDKKTIITAPAPPNDYVKYHVMSMKEFIDRRKIMRHKELFDIFWYDGISIINKETEDKKYGNTSEVITDVLKHKMLSNGALLMVTSCRRSSPLKTLKGRKKRYDSEYKNHEFFEKEIIPVFSSLYNFNDLYRDNYKTDSSRSGCMEIFTYKVYRK